MELFLILREVGLPAVVAALLGLWAFVPRRGRPSDAPFRVAALSLAVAFVAGRVIIDGWPPLWPKSASQWLPHAAVLGALVAWLTEDAAGRGATLRWFAVVTACALVVGTMFGSFALRQPPTHAALLLGSALLLAIAWWGAMRATAARLPVRPFAVMLGLLCAALGAVFAISGDVRAGEYAGAVGGGMLGLGILAWIAPRRCDLRFTTPVLVLVLAPLLLLQGEDYFGLVPRSASALLFAIPPATALVARLCRPGFVAVLPALLLGAAAVWLGAAGDPSGY